MFTIYSDITEIPPGKPKSRLLRLPGLTATGHCDWIQHHLFEEYEFGSRGNGFSRWNTPEGFPPGLLWEYRRRNNKARGKVLAVRCNGFDPNYNPDIRNAIRDDIRQMYRDAPCVFTGSRSNVELDHRAGDKRHPLHQSAIVPATQVAADFMPLCRSINQIKRQACKGCRESGVRPELPPLFAHLQMIDGEGCHGCFWFQPELYIK